jgi:hypothetical protein
MIRWSGPSLAVVFLVAPAAGQMVVEGSGGVATHVAISSGQQLPSGCNAGSSVTIPLVNLPLAPIFMPLGTRDSCLKHGDVAVNMQTDELWATDGELVVAFSFVTGLPVRWYSLPSMLVLGRA